MDKITHEVRLANWKNIIEQCNNRPKGTTIKHLLTELPKLCDEKGNIDSTKLDALMPWSEELPGECRKPRR